MSAAPTCLELVGRHGPEPTGRDERHRGGAAVDRNRIRRVVFQSSVGAEKRHGAGKIYGFAGTELALDGTDADTVRLRCAFLFTNLELQLDALHGLVGATGSGGSRTGRSLEAWAYAELRPQLRR